MECFEQSKRVDHKRLFVFEHISHILSSLSHYIIVIRNSDEDKLTIFNKKLELIRHMVDELP